MGINGDSMDTGQKATAVIQMRGQSDSNQNGGGKKPPQVDYFLVKVEIQESDRVECEYKKKIECKDFQVFYLNY